MEWIFNWILKQNPHFSRERFAHDHFSQESPSQNTLHQRPRWMRLHFWTKNWSDKYLPTELSLKEDLVTVIDPTFFTNVFTDLIKRPRLCLITLISRVRNHYHDVLPSILACSVERWTGFGLFTQMDCELDFVPFRT
jgi:hypothetical protein